ncbi:MAG: MarC family protein, partial [Fimbriimonas sp.]
AFSSLFAMLNPISAAPIFVAAITRSQIPVRRTAFRACVTAGLALALFAVAGTAVFAFFGVTVPAFQIAGGLLFTVSSIRALQGLSNKEEVEAQGDPSIVPLGIPTLAGAGALSTVMLLAGQARTQIQGVILGSVIFVNVLIALAVLLLAPLLVQRLGRGGTEALSRIMGLLTAVIGVQFIINGATTVVLNIAHQLK